ncbi:uncharacterized protein DEA37_0008757 [Paragonimus westermani]|uniref:Reverse transcriptase RNase H-like domain-containing protein n=1 Tax=Paragonimus westermani TaxID=34504 RepID=A0A5J4NFV8_9TREM|nr:uncharacterized protein DEA37_0008757 [Paragonimus westermani]
MLALVYFLKHFCPYSLGKPFKVLTDHQALQWTRNSREPEGQVARWLGSLQDYDFDCIYHPVSRHANAAALSRLPTETVNAMLSTPSAGATWAHYQSNDSYISSIYRRQLDGNPKPTGREIEGRSPAKHQSKSQHHQKSYYVRTTTKPVYRIEDHNWLYRSEPPLGAARKFHRPWVGSFVIMHVHPLYMWFATQQTQQRMYLRHNTTTKSQPKRRRKPRYGPCQYHLAAFRSQSRQSKSRPKVGAKTVAVLRQWSQCPTGRGAV